MVVLYVLLFIVITAFLYLFFAPFYFEINTTKGLYKIRFHRLASAVLKMINGSIIVEIKLAGWTKQIDLLTSQNPPKEKTVKKKVEVKFKENEIPWKKIKSVLTSFKVNKCVVSIDSGDMYLNGIIYPLFYGINVLSNRNIEVNFINDNKVILEIKNSLARMSWAYISS